MKKPTIQARLTAWYLLSLLLIVGVFVVGNWFAMMTSMFHSIDRDLNYRLDTVVSFIQIHALSTREQFEKGFANSSDSAVVGVFAQISNGRGELLYESDVLRSHRVPVLAQGPADGSVLLASAGDEGWPVRYAARRVAIGGTDVTVHVVEPLKDLTDALREYQLYLLALILIALVLTASAGYWMSRRALAPVEQIRRNADTIDPKDLTARLQVPRTDDELARLAQTLNAMLTRIESGFRSVQQFTADASHELRAPLALIITAGEVTLRRERSADELKDVLHKVVREARHLSSLVDSLLELARGDAEPRPVELECVDLAAILHELATQMIPVATVKGLTLRNEVPVREIAVLGDAMQLKRLFLILLDNAVKYSETGSVNLSVDTSGADVVVRVADTGIGIDPEGLQHVFDRFWRADKVRSRAEGGAGLGLALAAQIAQRIGGAITAESKPGKGSVFSLRLKAFRDDSRPPS